MREQVMTFTSEPDQMCIEGNLCAALGNAAHSDEVLERLGKTEVTASFLSALATLTADRWPSTMTCLPEIVL
jgi:hypothetical protein